MTTPTIEAIRSNITLIEERLRRALSFATEARIAIHRDQQNLAIGTLVPAEQDLADADALLKTVFVLHRSRPDTAPLFEGDAS